MTSSSSLARARWCSGTEGFVLSDAMIAIAVASAAVMISAAALHAGVSAQEKILDAYALSDQQFSEALSEISECQCISEPALSEKVADTSLSSF